MSVDSATNPLFNQTLESLIRLNNQSGKGLSLESLLERTHDLGHYLTESETIPSNNEIIAWHWADYAVVQALREPTDPAHSDTWQTTMLLIHSIVKKQSHIWQADPSNTFEDVCSTCLLTVWAALPSFRYHSSLQTWAMTVIINAIRKQNRLTRATKRDPKQRAEPGLEALLHIPAAEQTQPEAIIMAQEFLVIINEVLAHPEYKLVREVFLLAVILDMKGSDIAKRLGVAQSTVSQRLAAARALLAKHERIRKWLDSLFDSEDSAENE
ncbi:MAG TPA: RNA polymerase sigma factor [Herpetosiphon sp.]|uniref:RNA polymerase, sigma-24 subunit, ECF subfamily n=1 Tax=Herpetosiphon aurantiacus (strain ATCC 23779 / DSM 785 / 114-95) TaxID=316274 RepID=A9AVD4_HERA2|nr:RNA polymerase sigma factor [Herpetosiphon sp.]ABX04625.1 RNA polymerase, sigma-24 subunit, ECF subfamily [Herpetosiphon aurantiacus DSM 785]HBW48663.1 RNA polymerase sigma factor [Herpetosiphon sp.]